MASKLVPPNPEKSMVIRDIVPNIITTLSAPFLRGGHIKIGGRGTIVRLQSGALAVFSPVTLTSDVKDRLSALGEVRYITALDIEHHISLGPWFQAFPNAKVLGPEGLYEKRKKQGNEDVPIHVVFTAKDHASVKVDPEFDAEFEYEFVHPHPNKEIVFIHKPTKTLIQADLWFNLPATEQFSKSDINPNTGILTRIFNYFATSRQQQILWYAFSRSNRPAFNKSITRINSWDFNRMIPCHGDVIESGAKGIFQQVMEWHLDAAKKSS